MSLYTDLDLQDSVKEQLFRWDDEATQFRKRKSLFFLSINFLKLYREAYFLTSVILFVLGVSSTCWRRSAAPEWRSWGLSSENTCRTGSPLRRSWRRQSPSSPWEKPCWHTAATPNTHGTSCGCFLMQRTTCLRCAVNCDEGTDCKDSPKPYLSDRASSLSAFIKKGIIWMITRRYPEPSDDLVLHWFGAWRENWIQCRRWGRSLSECFKTCSAAIYEMFKSHAHRPQNINEVPLLCRKRLLMF